MSLPFMYRLIDFVENRIGVFTLICRTSFFVLVLVFSVLAQKENGSKDQIQTVSFCEVLKNPQNFDQKSIRIKAIYRYGFEWSELYCLDCRDKGLVWLDFEDSFDSLTKSKVRKNIKWSEKGRTVNIIAIGKFYTNGKFGHLGGYPYKFVAEYIESAEVILKDSPVVLPGEVRQKATCLIVK